VLGRLYAAARVLGPLVRPVRARWDAARLRLWALRADLELRRKGGRLELVAGDGVRLEGFPRIRAARRGAGSATLTVRLGSGVRIGRDVVIEVWARGTNVLEIGDHGLVFDGAILQLQGGAIRARDHVQIRTWCVVKSSAELTLGSGAILGYGAALHCAARIEVGELVGIAERVTIVDSDHALDGSDVHFHDAPVIAEPIAVGRNTFVATGAVIGRGVTIGPNAAVGANAVVTAGDYDGGMLIAGVPARQIKPLGQAAVDGAGAGGGVAAGAGAGAAKERPRPRR
jgi:acetyltransferase-like isoleucine patch superfamily enzyme